MKINLINTFMEHYVRMPEMYDVYTHSLYWQNAEICLPYGMYLFALSIRMWQNASLLFWCILMSVSSLILNDKQHMLKMKYTKAQSTSKEKISTNPRWVTF